MYDYFFRVHLNNVSLILISNYNKIVVKKLIFKLKSE